MTTAGLKIAIVKVLWTKGMLGISFFQKAVGDGMKTLGPELLEAVKADVIESVTNISVTATPTN